MYQLEVDYVAIEWYHFDFMYIVQILYKYIYLLFLIKH